MPTPHSLNYIAPADDVLPQRRPSVKREPPPIDAPRILPFKQAVLILIVTLVAVVAILGLLAGCLLSLMPFASPG